MKMKKESVGSREGEERRRIRISRCGETTTGMMQSVVVYEYETGQTETRQAVQNKSVPTA